jgi:hypothetical protein
MYPFEVLLGIMFLFWGAAIYASCMESPVRFVNALAFEGV